MTLGNFSLDEGTHSYMAVRKTVLRCFPGRKGIPETIVSRYVNVCTVSGGRLSIVRETNAMKVLVEAISGEDVDRATFALLCAGNLFMIPEARQRFLLVG